MLLQEEYDSANTVLFQKLKLLKNEILQLQNQSKILSNNYKPNDLEVKIEDDDNLKESFSSSMLQLEDKLENLKHLCNSEQIESEDCFVQTNNYSLVYIQFLNNLLSKFIEYITTLGDSYSIQENPDYFDQIKKSITKIRKKIKKLDLTFDPNLFPISEIEAEYGLTSILVKNVYKLKKKLTKLISSHRKKYNIPFSQETENLVEVKLKNKKRKHKKSLVNKINGTGEELTVEPKISESPKKSKKDQSFLSQDDSIIKEVEEILVPPENSKKDKRKDLSQEEPDIFLSPKPKKVKKDKLQNELGDLNSSVTSINSEISPKKSKIKKHSDSLSQEAPENVLSPKSKKVKKDNNLNGELSSSFLSTNGEINNNKKSNSLSQDEKDFQSLISDREMTPQRKSQLIPSIDGSDFESLVSPKKASIPSVQEEPEPQPKPPENGEITGEPSPKKLKRNSLSQDDANNLSQISESEVDITHLLEENMSAEKTPNSSPKKKNPNVSPNGLNNMLTDLVTKMKQNLFDKEKVKKEKNLKISLKKKELIDNFFETTIFDNDEHTVNEEEREDRIMAELAMDKQNIIDKSIFDLREMIEEAQNRTVISDDVKEKLKNLFIEVPVQVPSAHMIETRLTIGPTKAQQRLLEGYNLKLGIFSKEEDAILRRNWNNFCMQYDFDDPEPFLTWKHDKDTILDHKERVKFVQYLGQQLGHRMLCSIYRRFKRMYKIVKKGRFTKDDDEIILQHMAQGKTKGNKFAPLVPVLNRSRISIQLRYYRLISGDLNDKLKWDIDMDRILVKLLMKKLKVYSLEKLRNIKIKKEIWKKISKKMEIPEFKLIIHWNFKLYTQLFAEDRICWDELKLRLFDMLYDKKLDDWRTIDWRAIASNFIGFSPQFLWFLVKNNVRHQVPQQLHYSCRKSMKFIHKYVVPKLMMTMSKYDSDEESKYRKQLHRYKFDENNVLQSYYY